MLNFEFKPYMYIFIYPPGAVGMRAATLAD